MNKENRTIYISNHSYDEIIEITGESEQNYIFNKLDLQFNAKKNELNLMMKKSQLKAYTLYHETLFQEVPELSFNDLKVGDLLLPNHLILLDKKQLREVSYVGDNFYLYKNQNNEEIKDYADRLINFQKITINNKSQNQEKKVSIEKYKEQKANLISKTKIEEIVQTGLSAIKVINNDTKSSVELLLKYSFKKITPHTIFCLKHDIPVLLSEEEQKLFRDNNLNLEIKGSRERKGMWGFGDEDQEPIFDSLFVIRYFKKGDIINEIKELIEQSIDSID